MSVASSSSPQHPKKLEERSRSKETPQDVYTAFENSLSRYLNEVKANAASYLQSVSDLQQEIIESRKKNAEHAILLQQTVLEQLRINPDSSSDATMEIAKSFADQTTMSWNLQNQLVLKSLEILSKNIEAFNKNSVSFEKINKNLIDYWASIIKQASRE